jgi:hypothetical protein
MEQPRQAGSNRRSPYYSIRTGKNAQAAAIDLPTLLRLFKTLFLRFEGEGYFQEVLSRVVDEDFIRRRPLPLS